MEFRVRNAESRSASFIASTVTLRFTCRVFPVQTTRVVPTGLFMESCGIRIHLIQFIRDGTRCAY
jgi:hypothetical protein